MTTFVIIILVVGLVFLAACFIMSFVFGLAVGDLFRKK